MKSGTSNPVKSLQEEINRNQPKKQDSSKTVETLKTIVIAVLFTSIVAFIGGMRYQAHVNGQVKTEAKAIASLKQ